VNQFIAAAVAEGIGVMESARELLERRAGDAKPKDLLKYFAQGGTPAAGRIGPLIGSAGHPGLLPVGDEPSMAVRTRASSVYVRQDGGA
jgi:hypothetical protein